MISGVSARGPGEEPDLTTPSIPLIVGKRRLVQSTVAVRVGREACRWRELASRLESCLGPTVGLARR